MLRYSALNLSSLSWNLVNVLVFIQRDVLGFDAAEAESSENWSNCAVCKFELSVQPRI